MRETFIKSGDARIDALVPRIKSFLEHDVSEYNMLGTQVRGYRSPDAPSIWLRDHSDMLRGAKYWETDLQSTVDHFAETQTAKGWLFDYFTMTPEKIPCEKENWAKYVRVPVEPDVEYRFIKAIYLAWQATGDDRWMKNLLPNMERALRYILTDEWRWDKKTGLVKRGLSIDTWDFDYTAGRHSWLNFQINEHTIWGIMHGDNSGYYESIVQLSKLYKHLKNNKRARYWKGFAEALRKRANRICFNGRFYTHHVHLVPVTIEGVDEKEQLSLSNPMNINRGMATHEIAVAIINEYRRRAESTRVFAEWFSIDPPFPDGIYGDKNLIGGMYCNGGIMPLVGGELARAALEHGFEEYGVLQLLKYEELTRNNESYLWYFPDGRHATVETSTSPDASPTDGWGSSSMLYALIEGLAGIEDLHKLYQRVRLSPRWVAAGRNEAEARGAYAASGAFVEYSYSHNPPGKLIELELKADAEVQLHLLLPGNTEGSEVRVNGRKVNFMTHKVESSSYVDVSFSVKRKCVLEVRYQ